jgi:hypothetical protein
MQRMLLLCNHYYKEAIVVLNSMGQVTIPADLRAKYLAGMSTDQIMELPGGD